MATVFALVGTGEIRGVRPAAIALIPLVVLLAKLSRLYDRDELVFHKSTLDEGPALFNLSALVALVTWFGHDQLLLGPMGRPQTLLFWGIFLTTVLIGRSFARTVALRVTPPERCLVVGTSRERLRFARKLRRRSSIEVVGSLPLEEERRAETLWPGPERRRGTRTVHDLERIIALEHIQRVVILPGDAAGETILDSIGRAKASGVKVSIVPRLFEVVGSAVEFDEFEGTTVLGVRRFGLSRSSLMLKRAFDAAGAALCLLVMAPLFVIIALAIRLSSPGPVFFRQTRMGRGGRPFQMLKFRSMVDGAHAQRDALAHLNEADGLFKIPADPRVTAVGRLLRRVSIDELPQLINVLRGEMSLVGPRPLVLEEDSLVEGRHRGRLHLVPGITGPWQLLGPVRVPLQEMVVIDYLYGANWSLWIDVKILLRTLGHVFNRGGL